MTAMLLSLRLTQLRQLGLDLREEDVARALERLPEGTLDLSEASASVLALILMVRERALGVGVSLPELYTEVSGWMLASEQSGDQPGDQPGHQPGDQPGERSAGLGLRGVSPSAVAFWWAAARMDGRLVPALARQPEGDLREVSGYALDFFAADEVWEQIQTRRAPGTSPAV